MTEWVEIRCLFSPTQVTIAKTSPNVQVLLTRRFLSLRWRKKTFRVEKQHFEVPSMSRDENLVRSLWPPV